MAVATQAQLDAHALVRQTLASFGLNSPSLATWALESLIAGNSIDQILLELEQRPEFKTAFPEIAARQDKALATGVWLEPVGPAEILSYRTEAKALMRSFGLPESYYNNTQVLYNLVVNDRSLSELNDYLELTQRRVVNAPGEIGQVFAEVFGAQAPQALMLAFTNDELTLPALEEMVQTAEAGGAARRMGFGLSEAEMRRVADLNVSYDQAVQGFADLGQRRSLFDETLGETEDFGVGGVGVEAAFNAGTGGTKLARRAEERTASTAGQAGGLAEQRGATGLGAAGRR